jgi:hypothetical protein
LLKLPQVVCKISFADLSLTQPSKRNQINISSTLSWKEKDRVFFYAVENLWSRALTTTTLKAAFFSSKH